MIDKFIPDEWRIIEEGFDPETNRFSESIFSLGNEHMGLRGFFEEEYSGDSLQGTYVAGIFYPDKTKVGWWKIGYPEFFAKVVNSTNWAGIGVLVNDTALDLKYCRVRDFRRELDMRQAKLTRSFVWEDTDGKETAFLFTRFLSMADNNLACVTVEATPLNYSGYISFRPFLDGDVVNEDSNYGEKFWDELKHEVDAKQALLVTQTKKSGFIQATAMAVKVFSDGEVCHADPELICCPKRVGYDLKIYAAQGHKIALQKYVSVVTSRDYDAKLLEETALAKLQGAFQKGYHVLFAEHCREMARKWEESDIIIEGDPKAQQGIRYNIFQLNQTYTGKDPRLNIGPKGFTGEKYGGSTYWDTEAFCFPFYLYTNEEVAKNLLYYRYLHLERARENARKLGCQGALYPMVTMDGQECHNEWEITFEEIHRNAAIAYAIYNYTNYTGNKTYLFTYGLEVLAEISRYWADRVSFNPRKDQYMILGVTGPNEYDNNVNNNWYTNTMAAWVLEYTLASLAELQAQDGQKYAVLIGKLGLAEEESRKWREIIAKMYYPYVAEFDLFEQHDGYMDKEQLLVANVPPEELPINKHWSWDRILRSSLIKQADVIQAFYFLSDRFTRECKRRNFDFYEPRTVHESSLSPCIYSIVASQIGYRDTAYQLYLRAARLDLDNYNDDSDDGVHLTSMAGSWSAIVQGFAGVTVREERLHIEPYVPAQWQGYSFRITFRGCKLKVRVAKDQVAIEQLSGEPLAVYLGEQECRLQMERVVTVPLNKSIEKVM